MRATIVSCSPRDDSESLRISEMLRKHICEHHAVDCGLLSLNEYALEIFSPTSEVLGAIRSELLRSDMIIFVVPEHHGMAPPIAKQLFMVCGMECLAHKPALLIGISAGVGGAYPITDMRASTCKNSRILYLPEHIIIRKVCEVERDFVSKTAPDLRGRIDTCLQMLKLYAEGLSQRREKLLAMSVGVGYGM